MREQQMKALERANTVRMAAADVKRELRDGDLTVREALWDDRATVIPLRALLLMPRGTGPYKVDRFLTRLDVNGYRRVGELTERQRWVVADAA
jgi:hypothetical protein